MQLFIPLIPLICFVNADKTKDMADIIKTNEKMKKMFSSMVIAVGALKHDAMPSYLVDRGVHGCKRFW